MLGGTAAVAPRPSLSDLPPRASVMAAEFAPGDRCYFVDGDGHWVLGTVVEWDARTRAGACRSSSASAAVVEVNASRVRAVDPAVKDIASTHHDLVHLKDGHLGTLLHALLLRFHHGAPETYCGTTLVSINPQRVPGPPRSRYSIEAVEAFDPSAPHAQPGYWSAASKAYRNMLISRRSQEVFAFGVSGAGASEAARCVNRLLAYKYADCAGLGAAVGRVGLLLDCFTCARVGTVGNSSRAHRTTEWTYTLPAYGENTYSGPESSLLPAGVDAVVVRTSLLEVDRVSMDWKEGPGDGNNSERSFHAFYLLLKSGALREELGLAAEAREYRNLAKGAVGNRAFDTPAEWEEVAHAMERLEWSPIEIGVIWGGVGAVLHLQHTDVLDTRKPASQMAVHAHRERLAMAANSLGIPPEVLWRCTNIDGFCKALYASIVGYVQSLCNMSLSRVIGAHKIEAAVAAAVHTPPPASVDRDRRVRINPVPTTTASIRVTDFSGLRETDSTSTCSLGQLLLNASHEGVKAAYQQHWFRDHTSTRSIDGVKTERLTHQDTALQDNRPTLALLLGPAGAIQCVEECRDDAQIIENFRISRHTPRDSHQELPHLGGDPSKVHLRNSTKEYCCYRLSKRWPADVPGVQEALTHSEHPTVRDLPPTTEPTLGAVQQFVQTVKTQCEGTDVHWIVCLDFASQEKLAMQLEHASLGIVHDIQRNAFPLAFPKHGFVLHFAPLRMKEGTRDDHGATDGEPPSVIVGGEDPKPTQNAVHNNTIATTPGVLPLSPAASLDHPRVQSGRVSPERPLYRSIPGRDPAPTRLPVKCAPTVDALLHNAGVDVPMEAQVGRENVFLTAPAMERLEALKHDVENDFAKVLQAYSRALLTKARFQEKVMEKHEGLVADLRHAIRKELEIKQCMLDVEVREAEARAAVEDEQVWGLLSIAADYVQGFADAKLIEVVNQEPLLRVRREVDEYDAWVALVDGFVVIATQQLSKDDLIQRGRIMEEEFKERIEIFREFEAGWIEVLIHDEQTLEEVSRDHITLHEAQARAALAYHHREDQKPIVEVEESRVRREVVYEEADAWAACVDAMMAVYMTLAVEELELDEDLARFGYRGVGGIFHDEQREWHKFIMAPLADALAAHISEAAVSDHPSIESRYRAAIEADEAHARASLAHDFASQRLAFLYRQYYDESLDGREAVIDEEWRARKVLAAAYYDEKLALLVHGRGWEAEPAQRKLLEKVQRDATRSLYARKLQLYVEVQEEEYRRLMNALCDLQWDEIAFREEREWVHADAFPAMYERFEVGRKLDFDVHREETYEQMKRDGVGDEYLRRHYLELDDVRRDTEEILQRTGRSLERAESQRHYDTAITLHDINAQHNPEVHQGYLRSLLSHNLEPMAGPGEGVHMRGLSPPMLGRL